MHSSLLIQIGAVAVVIRQTNVIWVLLVACTAIINISVTHGKQNTKSIKSDVSVKHGLEYATGTNSEGFNLRKRKIVKSGNTIERSSSSDSSPSSYSGLLSHMFKKTMSSIL